MAKRNQQMSAREGERLHGQLTAYSAAVRISGAAGSLHRRFGNWPIYAAATGSALAMATGASASIISGTFSSNNSVTPKGSSASSIKGLIMGSGHEINIKANSGISTNGPWAALSVQGVSPVKIFVTSAQQDNVLNFAKGVQIAGAHKVSSAKIVNAFFTGKDFGDFKTAGKPGYAGLAIAVGAGQTDYGWIELEFTDNPETSLPYTLTVLAFGVETTANQPIDAGQTSDTPEPGTMALSLLASGAAGIMAWKRRRKQNAAL